MAVTQQISRVTSHCIITHTLLVDIAWDAFVSDRENCQADIDFAIILDAPGNVHKVREPSCIRNRAHVQIIEYRQGLTG